MSKDLKYALRFTADDQASAKVEQLNKTIERGSKQVADQVRQTSQEVIRGNEQAVRSHEKTSQEQQRATARGHSQFTRLYKDRERLGIRSEDRIRREIALTESAYRRLAQSGRLSGQEQARAYQQMTSRVKALRNELEATTKQQSTLGRAGGFAGSAITGAAQVVGGVMSAAHVFSAPVQRTVDFEQRLAYMANTAYAGEGLEAKKTGRETLRAAIASATKYGGSRDDAADALDYMIASGALEQDTAINLLPELQKAALATNSTTSEMSAIAVRAMQNFKITEEDIPLMLDIAAKAGEAGGFEIKDMARWLPELMAAGGTSGMSGLEDFKTLVSAAQASLITAGSTDAGGNNLKNLLMKINSSDTSRALENIEIAPGKSIDLSGTLAKARGEGKNSLDAFVGIVESIIGDDKEYQKLAVKIQSSDKNSPEHQAALEAQAALLQGSAVGQVIRDQQALLALVGYMNNKEYVETVRSEVEKAAGTNEENYQSVADTAKNKAEKRDNVLQDAEYTAYKDMTSMYGELALAVAEYSSKYPELTTFMLFAKDALKALAIAAVSATAIGGVSSILRGRGAAVGAAGLFGGLGKMFGGRFASTGPIAATAGSGLKYSALGGLNNGVGSSIGKGVLWMSAAQGAMGAYSIATSDADQAEKNKAYKNLAVDTAVTAGSSWVGAKAGAAVGSFGGPVGAAIGGVIGAIAGPAIVDGVTSIGGDVTSAISEWWSKDAKFTKPTTDGSLNNRINSGYSDDIYQLSLAAHLGQTQAVSPEELQTIVQFAVEQGVQSGVEKARKVPQELSIHTTVDVAKESIVATVNAVNRREARRN
ncbi:phage tail tape measure protein [Oligella urethralis]|uniref:phage tail tape measure protein n=1 Tax=Oligella urethralis TaxID=90245 RepID=UPI00288BF902|nr:phage tail tape measure protein [Oligella urethralis]